MQEHVGKKRRKEVRAALDMRTELRRSMAFMVCALIIAAMVTLGMTFAFISADPTIDNTAAQTIPTIVLFIFVIFLGSRSYKWSGLKKEYDEHLKRYNITKADMEALKDGQL